MSDLFNPERGGIEHLCGWMGQVVDEAYWAPNYANKEFKHKLHSRDDVAGYGYRYKVRIFGRDTVVKDVPDDQLEMAEVLLPVTAGSGHGGSVQTPNIRQGCYVWGFYKDGIDGTEPIIVGVLPNHSQTRLFGGDPDLGYVPRSGYKGKTRDLPVSTKNLRAEGPSSIPHLESPQTENSVSNVDQNVDGKRGHYVPKTRNCDGANGEIKGIQKVIKQVLAAIKRIKKEVGNFLGAVSNLTNDIKKLVDDVVGVLSGLVKSLFAKIRGYIVNKLNNAVKDLLDKLPPNKRPGAADAQQKATDTIQCVFNKIISRLANLIKNILTDIIDKYINAPLCAAENFIATLLSSIFGELTNAIDQALGFINGILGIVNNIADQFFNALDFLTGILNFLSCDENLDCSMNDEWSFWDGLRISYDTVTGDFGKKLKQFATSNQDFGGNLIPNCGVSQVPCGPPILQVYGGGGSGLSGNVVVGALGNILGIDITNPGSGYKSAPKIQVTDNCGSGNGAVFEPVLTLDTSSQQQQSFDPNQPLDFTNNLPPDENYIVDTIVVVDPGAGYLQGPDGSTGGDGVKFSNKCDTIVDTNVYPPGTTIKVLPGQTIYLPSGTSVNVFDTSGNILQTLSGAGQVTGIPIQFSGSLTTPDCPPSTTFTPSPGFPTIPINNPSNGSYQVVTSIKDVAVLNPGSNYSPGDTIQITPDNGAQLNPIFDDNGSLTNVTIISGGKGFTDFPRITINSQTGFNAVIIPVFEFTRITNKEDLFNIPPGTSVINVIDCVGKVTQ